MTCIGGGEPVQFSVEGGARSARTATSRTSRHDPHLATFGIEGTGQAPPTLVLFKLKDVTAASSLSEIDFAARRINNLARFRCL